MLGNMHLIKTGKGEDMIKGYINCILSKHFMGCALEEHFTEGETFYDVLYDKLGNLALTDNLPIYTGFYTEYLDKNEIPHTHDDKFVIRNYQYQS
jgi:hypothetical protein